MYRVKITVGKDDPKYLHRGSLVKKSQATEFATPEQAHKALAIFVKQRGKLIIDIEKVAK